MRKKTKKQLVVQYVERISRKLLEKYPKIIREFARRKHGIYALYKGNKLHYVGLASNLRNRLRSHLRDKHGATWDRFSMYLTLSDEHLRELESLVLCIANPKGNVLAGKFKKAKNLKRIIKSKIKEIMRLEQRDLLGEDDELVQKKIEKTEQKNLGTLAPYATKRFHIRFRYKGKLYIANVRKNGSITFDFRSADYKRFKGKKYRSPSGAGKAVTGRSCDGWRHWKYRNKKGQWVNLNMLRKMKK
jgi:hypothetical protein